MLDLIAAKRAGLASEPCARRDTAVEILTPACDEGHGEMYSAQSLTCRDGADRIRVRLPLYVTNQLPSLDIPPWAQTKISHPNQKRRIAVFLRVQPAAQLIGRL